MSGSNNSFPIPRNVLILLRNPLFGLSVSSQRMSGLVMSSLCGFFTQEPGNHKETMKCEIGLW